MSSEKKSNLSRRDFLATGLYGLTALSSISALTACSTFNEYVFEDQFDLKDQVLIVGGGVGGLYLAYKLRQSRTEYRLLEGSAQFGGRIRSYQGLDYGASLFNHSDARVQQLVKEFNLVSNPISKDQFYLAGGAETLIQAMQNRISGLMPYRSLRLKWKLVGIHKSKSIYEAIFETPNGRRTIECRKVALTLPPSQWASVEGLLNLPEMLWARDWLKTLAPVNVTKVQWTTPNANVVNGLINKKNKNTVIEKDVLAMTAKNLKNNALGVEFEYFQTQQMTEDLKIADRPSVEIEKLIEFINLKSRIGISAKRLTADAFFDWSSVQLIQSAYFKNSVPVPENSKKSSTFQIFGDYSASVKPHSVEGALLEADRVSSVFV